MSRKIIRYVLLLVIILVVMALGAGYMYYLKYIKIPDIVPGNDVLFVRGQHQSYKGAPHILFTDFENNAPDDKLYDELSKSGKYSYTVFGKDAFSAVVSRTIGETGTEKPSKAGFSAWVYVFDENFEDLKADLVFSIVGTDGQNVVWKGVTLNPKFMSPGKWVKLSGSADIDTNTIKDDYTIKTYLWNDSRTRILVDDILVITGTDAMPRGDTVYCDISEGKTWTPAFNTPPFQNISLTKEQIGSAGPYLCKNSKGGCGKLMPHQRLFTGNFYNTSDGRDKILALENGKLNAYSYCLQDQAFTHDFYYKVTDTALWKYSSVYAAPFTGNKRDELLLLDTNAMRVVLLAAPDRVKGCTKEPLEATGMNTLWEGPLLAFDNGGKKIAAMATPHFLAPANASLLVVYTDGHWKLFDFDKSQWTPLAQSKTPVQAWDSDKFNTQFTTAPLYGTSGPEVLLSVSSAVRGTMHVYMLHTWNKQTKTLHLVPRHTVYGTDSLKAANGLYPAFDGTKTFLLKADTAWRFDMKLLAFNDTTYRICGQTEFEGIPYGLNPKFYEIVRLHPGRFIHPNKTSLLVLAYNKGRKEGNKPAPVYATFKNMPNLLCIFTPDYPKH